MTGFYIPQYHNSTYTEAPGQLDLPFFNPPIGFEGDNGLWTHADNVVSTFRFSRVCRQIVEINYRYTDAAITDVELILGMRWISLYESLGIFTGDDDFSFRDVNMALTRPGSPGDVSVADAQQHRRAAGRLRVGPYADSIFHARHHRQGGHGRHLRGRAQYAGARRRFPGLRLQAPHHGPLRPDLRSGGVPRLQHSRTAAVCRLGYNAHVPGECEKQRRRIRSITTWRIRRAAMRCIAPSFITVRWRSCRSCSEPGRINNYEQGRSRCLSGLARWEPQFSGCNLLPLRTVHQQVEHQQ